MQMSEIRNVYYEITSFHNLMEAEKEVAKGKHEKAAILRFESKLEDNLMELQNNLRRMRAPKVQYKSFMVYDPKVRRVIYIDYWNKIVQRAFYDVINPKLCKKFIADTYACIPGRGQLPAMKRLYEWFQMTRTAGGKWYYYKFDVAKFFYRIDHEILMKICEKKIGDKRAIALLRYYVCNQQIPFGMPETANQATIKTEEMEYDVGIPIGGGLSHTLGNLYLDELDQYAKRVLQIDKYERYMDDVVILDNDKERIKRNGKLMEDFVIKRLNLHFNKKTALRPVTCGCEFVGYNIFQDHVILRKSTTLRMKRHMKKKMLQYQKGEITFAEADSTVQCYKAMMKHVNSTRLEEEIWDWFVLTHGEFRRKEIREEADPELWPKFFTEGGADQCRIAEAAY
jgi:RNA-directed DNA polymerase